MESKSTITRDENNFLSIINLSSLLSIADADFSEWDFYDDSVYESTFNPAVETMDRATG